MQESTLLNEHVLQKARGDLEHNQMVFEKYQKSLAEAEQEYRENFREVDAFHGRWLGVIAQYRDRHPESKKTDMEVVEYMKMLMEKYKDE